MSPNYVQAMGIWEDNIIIYTHSTMIKQNLLSLGIFIWGKTKGHSRIDKCVQKLYIASNDWQHCYFVYVIIFVWCNNTVTVDHWSACNSLRKRCKRHIFNDLLLYTLKHQYLYTPQQLCKGDNVLKRIVKYGSEKLE